MNPMAGTSPVLGRGGVRVLDVQAIRLDFPILARPIHGKRLVYLDSAATTQKPRAVIAALSHFYEYSNANIHRGVHTLAEEATTAFEGVREKVAAFVGAPEARGVVFTRNTTEAINLVRYAWARTNLKPGHEIVITEMEHHANFVPWIEAARDTGATLRHARINDDGTLDMEHLKSLIGRNTRLVAVAHVSNVLGTINPVREIASLAHAAGAKVLVDGAQSVPHMPVSFAELGCDFLAFSAHKMLGPTGVGVLVASPEILAAMPPFNTGGSMIREVKPDRATWNDLPWKFEAGTPDIGGVIAFGAALDYLTGLGMVAVRAHELALTRLMLERLAAIPSLTVYGPPRAEDRGGVVAFTDADIHPHDLAQVLDQHGVAIRAGHHCAQPLHTRLGVVATARASVCVHNDRDDLDALSEAIRAARSYFGFTNA